MYLRYLFAAGDSNHSMQQSGGLLPARAGPSRTLVFVKDKNAVNLQRVTKKERRYFCASVIKMSTTLNESS